MEFLFSLAAGIFSIVFGIIATLSEYRDKTGMVKASAIWVIVGIACSAALGIVANELAATNSATKTSQRHELLLKSVWENQNKTEAASVKVLMNISYGTGVGELPPVIFQNSWQCKINAKRGTNISSDSIGKKVVWSDADKLKDPDFTLMGNFVEIGRTVKRTVDDNQFNQTNYISEFTIAGGNPKSWRDSFGTITDWNNLSLELVFHSSYDSQFGRWNRIVDEGDWGSTGGFWTGEFQKYYNTDQYKKMPDHSINPLPCDIEATVFIGDRALRKLRAIPAEIRMYDEDVSRTIVVCFPIIKLPVNYFPGFEYKDGDSQPNDAKNSILLLIGWFLCAVIVLSFGLSIAGFKRLIAKPVS